MPGTGVKQRKIVIESWLAQPLSPLVVAGPFSLESSGVIGSVGARSTGPCHKAKAQPCGRPARIPCVDTLGAKIWHRLKRPLTSERFDDTVQLAGTGMLVLAVSALFLILAWKGLGSAGTWTLGVVGFAVGLVWIVAGWAIWTRRPWADAFAAGVHALALVCQIVIIGPWSFWTLVLACLLLYWVLRARRV